MKTQPHDWLIIALLLAVLMLGSAECKAGGFLEIGTGYNVNLTGCSDCWNDAGANFFGSYIRLGAEKKIKEGVSYGVHWTHLSQWFEGPPFNRDNESTVDHLGIFVRFD